MCTVAPEPTGTWHLLPRQVPRGQFWTTLLWTITTCDNNSHPLDHSPQRILGIVWCGNYGGKLSPVLILWLHIVSWGAVQGKNLLVGIVRGEVVRAQNLQGVIAFKLAPVGTVLTFCFLLFEGVGRGTGYFGNVMLNSNKLVTFLINLK